MRVCLAFFAMRVASKLPLVGDRAAVGLGAALGATMGVRIGGVVLAAYMVVLLALHFIWVRGRTLSPVGSTAARAMARTAAIVVVISFALTFVLWPSAWPLMFDKAMEALLITAKFKFGIDVLFQGELVDSRVLPLTYLPGYFAVKLPEVVLALFAMSLPLAAWRLVRAYQSVDRVVVFGYAALALGIFFPLGFAMIVKSTHYDALRHFLFVLPPMSVLIGVELSGALAWLGQKRTVLSTLAGLGVIAGLVMPVTAMVGLHPYAYTYYNRFVGGAAGAQGQYELDYWATSYREAAEWLRAANEVPDTGAVAVYVCGPTDSAARFLPQRFRVVKSVKQAQFFIGFTRWRCDTLVEAPVMYTVERSGARFATVKDLRGGFKLLGKMRNNITINEEYPRYGQN